MARAGWTSTACDAEVRFEIGPAGFTETYRTNLLWAIGLLVTVGMFGLFGLYLARTETYMSLGQRLALGCVSAVPIVLPVWYGVKAVLAATLARHRIRVVPGGVLIEWGILGPRRTWWLAPLASVVTRPYDSALILKTDGPSPSSVAIVCADVDGLRQAIEDSRRSLAAVAGETDPPSAAPFGLARFLVARLLDLLRSMTRPTPFVVLDLGLLTATLLLARQLQSLDLMAIYPSVYVLFVLGVAARRLDSAYLAELARRSSGDNWDFAYVGAAVIMALPGVIVMRPLCGAGPGLLIMLVIMVGLHGWHMFAARPVARPAPPSGPQRVLNFVLAMTLMPIGAVHESVIFGFAADAARDLGPFGLALLPVVVLFGYWPIRLHAVIADPNDRANALWFGLTVISLSLFALLTMADGWGAGHSTRSVVVTSEPTHH